jgi:Mrp family chromosome partitioning ATPase
MPDLNQIRDCLDSVQVPLTLRSLNRLNLVRDIALSDAGVTLTLAAAALSDPIREIVRADATRALKELPGAADVTVEFNDDTPQQVNRVGRVIAVMSGKGGVGKSLVTALTAVALRRRGYTVGVLDADITGPSIPRIFGVTGHPGGSRSGILPLPTAGGIQIISINMMLPHEGDAVVWRGPIIGKLITQFWEEVLWGRLDYLIVDLPPGTADAPLTVLQNLPVDGVLIVTTPQSLAGMIVKKAVDMVRRLEKPIIGVVENMSYLYVPELDRKIEVFGPSGSAALARAAGAPVIANIPIDPALAVLCDRGGIEEYRHDVIDNLADAVTAAAPPPDTAPLAGAD